MMQLQLASLYRSAPLVATGLSITFVWLWALAHSGQVEGMAMLVFLASFPYGSSMGQLITYILGHALKAPPGAVVMTPTRSYKGMLAAHWRRRTAACGHRRTSAPWPVPHRLLHDAAEV